MLVAACTFHVNSNVVSTKISFVKVFGERNTGTNFLNQLIRKNTNLIVLEHGNNSLSKERFNSLRRGFPFWQRYSPALKSLVLDRLIDQQRNDEYLENFGWKHAFVDVKDLEVSPRFDQTFFIFLVRNPWRFVSALHRRPYNLFPRKKCNISEFVDSCFIANERDRLPCNFVESPIDFWNLKVDSYFKSRELIDNSLICYYEDVMRSPHHFLKLLAPYCDVSGTFDIPNESTKGDKKVFADYQKEAAAYDPKTELGEDAYLKILAKLDEKTLRKTPYFPACPGD